MRRSDWHLFRILTQCDALGRFWIGTIDESRSAHDAALFCLDGRGGGTPTLSRKAGPATTANGLAWSPDGRTMYWADTHAMRVDAFDFELPDERIALRPARPRGVFRARRLRRGKLLSVFHACPHIPRTFLPAKS